MTPWYLVLVTGSRRVSETARDIVRATLLKHIDKARQAKMDAVLVHGACKHPNEWGRWSVDFVAAEIDSWDQVIAMPMSGRDGKPRNERMVELAKMVHSRPLVNNHAVVEAFPSPKSRGTRNCIRLAREAGLYLTVTEVE